MKIKNFVDNITHTCKRISKKLGFDGYFTYYSARHTSTTIALNLGVEGNTVSKLLDHKHFSTLDFYAGDAEEIKMKSAMPMLLLK